MSKPERFLLEMNHVPPTRAEQTNRVMRVLEPELRKLRTQSAQVTRRQWIYGLLSAGAAAALGVVVWTRREEPLSPPFAATPAVKTHHEPNVKTTFARLEQQYGEAAPIVADLELYEDFEVLQAWNGRKENA